MIISKISQQFYVPARIATQSVAGRLRGGK